MAEISEIKNVDAIEVGGNAARALIPKDITNVRKYFVKDFEISQTKWGARVDFLVTDDFDEYKLSSWNFVSKKSFKPIELIGKLISLTPKDEKKLTLEILN